MNKICNSTKIILQIFFYFPITSGPCKTYRYIWWLNLTRWFALVRNSKHITFRLSKLNRKCFQNQRPVLLHHKASVSSVLSRVCGSVKLCKPYYDPNPHEMDPSIKVSPAKKTWENFIHLSLHMQFVIFSDIPICKSFL